MYEIPACPVMIVRYHNEQTVNDRYPRCRAGEMVGAVGDLYRCSGATSSDSSHAPRCRTSISGQASSPQLALLLGNHKALWGG